MPDPGEPYTETDRTARPPVRWNMASRSLPTQPTAGAGSYELSPAGGPRTEAAMTAALAYVRSELARVDPKAGQYMSLSVGLLVAALTIAVAGRLPGPAAAALWAAAAQDGLAVLLLTAASRPRLDGSFGFCRWAAMQDPADVLADVAAAATASEAEQRHADAMQLHWLSRAVRAKHIHITRAQTLLVTGAATGVLAAVLTLLTR